MPDRRTVDDLSIEELEQILRVKKREARMARLHRLEQTGRRKGQSPITDSYEVELPVEGRMEYESYSEGENELNPQKERTIRDRLLLGIEVLAVVGIVSILAFAAYQLNIINRESAEAQAAGLADLPTATATPIITAVVLPGGHTPPTSPEGAQPNYEEVPAHLRPIVEQQFAGPLIIPTTTPGGAIRIRIPALGVDAPIVQGDGWEQLKKGVGQHLGTALPGQAGNIVLSAHNDIFGEIFRYLDQLQPDDEIIVESLTQEFTYRVAYYRVVEPTEVSVLGSTREPIVTLISCYPYLVNNQRIVVVAELQ